MNLVDTDILIEYFKKKEIEKLSGNAISIITLIEFLRGAKDPKTVKEILEDLFFVFNIDNEIIVKYTEIYRDLKTKGIAIDDADLIIASTSITKSVPLITRNLRHFERLRIYGLVLNNLF